MEFSTCWYLLCTSLLNNRPQFTLLLILIILASIIPGQSLPDTVLVRVVALQSLWHAVRPTARLAIMLVAAILIILSNSTFSFDLALFNSCHKNNNKINKNNKPPPKSSITIVKPRAAHTDFGMGDRSFRGGPRGGGQGSDGGIGA